jgi:hypothetical protein
MIKLNDINRVVQCPASHNACAQYPARVTESMQEGKTAKWLLKRFFELGVEGHFDFDDEGFEITDEMVDGANLFVNTVYPAGEFDLPIEWGNCSGHFDYAAISSDGYICLYDYHFGHKAKTIKSSLKFFVAAYAMLAETQYKLKGFKFTVVQPRVYTAPQIVEELFDLEQVYLYKSAIETALRVAESEFPFYATGSECLTCSHRANCERLQSVALNVMQAVDNAPPFECGVKEKAIELSLLIACEPLLKARVSGLEEELTELAKQGQQVPGFILKQGRGMKKWTSSMDMIKRMFGQGVVKEVLLTPNQAIEKGYTKELVEALYETVPGKVSLERSDDKIKRYLETRGAK